jgi:uracil-DNA glycosylase family 4
MIQSFFDKDQLMGQAPYKSAKGFLSCVSCGLYTYAVSPRVAPYGEFRKDIMVIGEAPSENEEENGVPWQGKMGRVLQHKYKQLGIDLFKDCISLNAVFCRPVDKSGNDRPPTEHEMACCRQKVLSAIRQYAPKVIILHGGAPLSSLITGYRWHGNPTGIMAWQGWSIPDRELNAWVCPTFHPSFVEWHKEEEKGQSEVERIWTQDLKQAFSLVDEPFPDLKKEQDCVIISYDVEDVLTKILRQKPSLLAFDIETTGIKPYNKENHVIVSISFCMDLNEAYAIPFPTDPRHVRLLKRILEHPKIRKIAANMKYEDNWMSVLHNINVNPWAFDTMLATHILDNRPGICGLKFQSFVRFGLPSYDEDISPFLKSTDTNTPNSILELVTGGLSNLASEPGIGTFNEIIKYAKTQESFRKLLLYNGIDSLMTYRLAMLQMKEMREVG